MASDGNLYGFSSQGGAYGSGTIFQYNTSTGVYTDEVSLNNSTGIPGGNGNLIEYTTVSHHIATQSASQIVCRNDTAFFFANDSSTFPVSAQWQVSTDSGASYSIIPDSIASTYSLIATDSVNGYIYRAIFSSGDTSAPFTLTVAPPSTSNQSPTICYGAGLTVGTVTHGIAGIYIDTLHGASMYGCDSIVTTHLSVWPPDTFSQTQAICHGQIYSINGYTYSSTGVYTDTLPGMGLHGCDSIVTTTLIVWPADTLSVNQTICSGDSFIVGGQTYTTTGIYTDTLQGMGIHGCDSVITIHLTVLDSVHAYFTLQPSGTPHVWYITNLCSGPASLSYVWSWGDSSANSIGDTASHTYDSAGYYTVCVTVSDSQGCTSSYCDTNTYLFKNQSGQMVYIQVLPQYPSGISIGNDYHFSISPNPTLGNFTIQHNYTGTVRVQLVDMLGQQIREYQMTNPESTYSISDLSTGIYEVLLSGDNNQILQVLKLVKE